MTWDEDPHAAAPGVVGFGRRRRQSGPPRIGQRTALSSRSQALADLETPRLPQTRPRANQGGRGAPNPLAGL